MDKNMENWCYNCGSREADFYAEENGFSLVKCSGCGLVYMQNMPNDNEISEAHRQGVHKGIKELDATGSFEEKKITFYIKVINDLYGVSLGNIRSWLDVGCGHGEFIVALNQFSKSRISIGGTEPNIRKRDSARSKGLNVEYLDITTHDKTYDGISLLNVYSHLPDPPLFIKRLKDRLNPGGELVLQTGDTAGFDANDHYRPFFLPDHVSFASEEIVINILKRLGFHILKVKKYPYPNLFKPDLTFTRALKETVKTILPSYHSAIQEYIHYKKMYSKTDMYIRAKMKS